MRIRIYTDGACSGNPGPGGWGAIILLPNDKQEISGFEKETTNNRMELKAAVESLKLALKLGYKKIDLYSDSAYVVNAVKQEWIKKWQGNFWKTSKGEDVKNKELWLDLINVLKKSETINFIKVKGHAGDKYNERVDQIARNQIIK